MADDKHTQIDALLQENRHFDPPPAFVAAAHVARPEGLRGGRTRPRGILGGVCRRARVEHAVDAGARLAAATRQVVRRRHAQRERELPGPARPRLASQQGRDHLGGGARRSTHHHVLGAVPRRLPVRQRAQVAGHPQGRSHRALPATHSRAGHRDARLRPHRRRAQRGLRGLQRRIVARSHQRSAGAPAHHGRRRLPPRQRRAAQAGRRRGPAGYAVDRERHRRAAPHQQSVHRRVHRRARPLVPRPDAQGAARVRARADGRRGHALHPLHVGHDRQAQGHRAYDRRVSHRAAMPRRSGCST